MARMMEVGHVFCSHICGCPVSCHPNCSDPECYAYTHSAIKEVPKMTSKDPNSWIQASAETLAETLLSKNSDYAPSGEFSNFERAARAARISVLQVIFVQAEIKMTRLEKLLGGDVPANESLKDSFLDLAGYATIAHAYLSVMELDSKPHVPIEPNPHWLVRDEG